MAAPGGAAPLGTGAAALMPEAVGPAEAAGPPGPATPRMARPPTAPAAVVPATPGMPGMPGMQARPGGRGAGAARGGAGAALPHANQVAWRVQDRLANRPAVASPQAVRAMERAAPGRSAADMAAIAQPIRRTDWGRNGSKAALLRAGPFPP